MTVIETARFRLSPGTAPDTAVAAWRRSQNWLRKQPGLLSRRLVESAEGEWIDLVEWSDMAAAQAAQAVFDPGHADLAGFIAAIDMGSIVMGHYHQRG